MKLLERFDGVDAVYNECFSYFKNRIACCSDVPLSTTKSILEGIAFMICKGSKVLLEVGNIDMQHLGKCVPHCNFDVKGNKSTMV